MELLVVIAIIALLAALLLPALSRARDRARQIQCLANEKQIGAAAYVYASDYNDAVPTMAGINPYNLWYVWAGKLNPYLASKSVAETGGYYSRIFRCPSHRWDYNGNPLETFPPWWGGISYGINMALYTLDLGYPAAQNGGYTGARLSALRTPTEDLYVAEQSYPIGFIAYPAVAWLGPTDEWGVGDFHPGIVNVLFADGHVQSMLTAALIPSQSSPQNVSPWNWPDWVGALVR